MRYERTILEVESRALTTIGIVISEMHIHSLIEKPQSDSGHLSIISISLGWIENHAYEAFSVTKIKSVVLQERKGNGSSNGLEALVLQYSAVFGQA